MSLTMVEADMHMSLKDLAVQLTMTLPGIPPKRGRRATGRAMTGAQRQANFRKSRALVPVGDRIGETIKRLAQEFELSEGVVTRELLRFALCNKNWSQTGFPSQVTKNEGVIS